MNKGEYGRLLTSQHAKRIGSTGFLPPGQVPAIGIGFSGDLKPNTASQQFANRIQTSNTLMAQHRLPVTSFNGLPDGENMESTHSTLPNVNYSLHNYNLKYHLIRQLLEAKGADEISDMRQKLQLQSIKNEHFQKVANNEVLQLTTVYLNEDAVWNDYNKEQQKLENFNKMAADYRDKF